MERVNGNVNWFDEKKGFGFIQSEGKDYFVHYSAINGAGYKTLSPGQRISFEIKDTPKGKCAVNVQGCE
jgi:CspA family cold shock protein